MRILFVAPYPPPFDERTLAAVEHVRRLREAGDHVEVLTPTPTAAAHHCALDSWWVLASLTRLVRGFDRVVVATELAELAPLRVALRAAHAVQTWPPPTVPESTTTTTPPPAGDAVDPPAVDPPAVAWPADRHAAMHEIRARAARRQVPRAGGADLGARLRQVPPLALPAAESARPGAGTAKRMVRRLTAWEVDPLVAQVNMLRAALIDALEAVERRDDG